MNAVSRRSALKAGIAGAALSAPVVDQKLFVETAVSGASRDANVIDLGAQLFKQVAGVK